MPNRCQTYQISTTFLKLSPLVIPMFTPQFARDNHSLYEDHLTRAASTSLAKENFPSEHGIIANRPASNQTIPNRERFPTAFRISSENFSASGAAVRPLAATSFYALRYTAWNGDERKISRKFNEILRRAFYPLRHFFHPPSFYSLFFLSPLLKTSLVRVQNGVEIKLARNDRSPSEL